MFFFNYYINKLHKNSNEKHVRKKGKAYFYFLLLKNIL